MLFNSLNFLVFFPIVVLVYYIMPKKIKNIWLLICSYYFYMCWNPKYIILLLFSTVVTYASSIIISKSKNKRIRKCFLILGIVLNLLVLVTFKYYNFLFDNIKRVFDIWNITVHIPTFDFLLPVGISFYTFQALGYMIDVYRERVQVEKNFFQYALFVSFFPQLVAGPIERTQNLLTELKREHRFKYEKVRQGFLTMLYGFALKMILADRIAIYVDSVYNNYAMYPGWYLIVATVLFAFQIYCDFYGYSTIAVGAAKILDIHLMENFESPYLSMSIKEFWRRWHISLSSWFKDYLYIPLGGNKKGKIRKYVNLLVVFLASGLWHGASWTYVIWGLLNGLYQVIGGAMTSVREKLYKLFKINKNLICNKILSILFTFCLIDFSWIFFRASSLNDSLKIIKSIFTANNPWIIFDGSIFQCGLDGKDFVVIIFGLVFLCLMDICKYKKININEIIEKQAFWFRWFVYILFIISILVFGIWGTSYVEKRFIYFQF